MANKLLKDITLDDTTYDVPITGVKGGAETNYRIGNVNIVPNHILNLGTNITGGVANDTQAFWTAKSSGYAYFNQTNMLNGQPSQYGLLEHMTTGNGSIVQTFRTLDNRIFIRYTSGAVTTMSSWKELAGINSPTFTGTPKAPTNTDPTTSDTQIATTGFVHSAISNRFDSPTFTGIPKAPTNTTYSTSNTQIATTAFVQNAITRRFRNKISVNVANKTIANNTQVFTPTWEAPSSGVLIATQVVTFSTNATGSRHINIMKQVGSTQSGLGSSVRVGADTIGGTTLSVTVTNLVDANDQIGFRALQTSGASLTMSDIWFTGLFFPDA